MIKTVLISNRGEIAIRIMRTAKAMGYTVISIYSEQDKDSAHVKLADKAVLLKGNTIAETYLNIPAIIQAAKDNNADAIHPGYGFLSENPLFAEACEKAGIIFVGPASSSIRAMGNKIAAREIAKQHHIPIAPGITGSARELLKNHSIIGFPILIKAAAGGGGKGMRIVRSAAEMEAALQSTSSEASNYFGDGTIYIERFFDGPRHIEVQVIGDKNGNLVHLFERECSVQRRHQKIIEEAPSPTLTPEVREKMCSAAITLASSIGYQSAGTIEFLVDNELNFYFLEMNTRIQVEHPVTEYITGIDIVKEQFNIAEGKELSFKQSDITINGHAIEVRVYAEDPLNNFMPSPGKILKYSYPKLEKYNGEVRVDDAMLQDDSIIYSSFDPLISKVIAHSNNRNDSIEKLSGFINHYSILGIKTNLSYLQVLLNHIDYVKNNIHTRYIDNNYDKINETFRESRGSINTLIPFTGGLLYSFQSNFSEVESTVWNQVGYWRVSRKLTGQIDGESLDIILEKRDNDSVTFSINEGKKRIHASIAKANDGYILIFNDNEHKLYMVTSFENHIFIKFQGHEFVFERFMAPDDRFTVRTVSKKVSDVGDIISPMPGKVLSIKVNEGVRVEKGDLLMVIEAMKMENNILAPYSGIVDKLMVKVGSNVDTTSHLIHLGKTLE
ncbi:MAG TPA: biotin carboxylase N-terminal domain-containing protein [Lentimicrobium sp.]|nr:biotin carboxylase N-terminal domain-containing protein [Lentimicrobium sp.]